MAPTQAAELAAYPADAVLPSGGRAAPLANGVPGYAFAVEPEALFDALFRRLGAGSFEESYRRDRRATVISDAGVWAPALPQPGEVCRLTEAAAEGQSPRRSFIVERPSPLPSWMRALGSAPTGVTCSDEWVLVGLGAGLGFLVDFTSRISGIPAVGTFSVRARYRGTALGGGRSQLDAELELGEVDSSSSMGRRAIEVGVLTEFRRAFEGTFLPLATKAVDEAAGRGGVGTSEAAISAGPSEFNVHGSFHVASSESRPEIENEYAEDWGRVIATSESLAGEAVVEPADGDFLSAPPISSRGPGGGTELLNCERRQCSEDEDDLGGTVATGAFELRVEVLGATELADPEYRVGDVMSTLMSGRGATTSAVYAEFTLGKRSHKTGTASTEEGARSVSFDSERLLFAYHGELALEVSCWDARKMQAMLRGDPLIGRGSLPLPQAALQGLPAWADIDLSRNGRDGMGKLHLRYQFLRISAIGVSVAAGVPTLQTLPPSAEADESDDAYFTPRNSDEVL